MDNYTNQWLLVRGLDHFIEPYTVGAILPLNGPQIAEALFQAPFNFPQVAPINGQSARFIFFENTQYFNPGKSVAGLVQGQIGINATAKPSYSSTSDLFVVAANATDVWQMGGPVNSGAFAIGAAGAVVVTRLQINGVQTTAGIVGIRLGVQTGVDGGGIADSIIANDFNDPAPRGIPTHFTANPALGAPTYFKRFGLYISAATASAPDPNSIIELASGRLFGPNVLEKPLLLRYPNYPNPGSGIPQSLVINLLGTTPAGLNLIINCEWYEDLLA